jgi:predicted DNA-binding protein with PD1-like motif
MRWGVFDTGEHVHVAPVDINGDLCGGHLLDEFCLCDPSITEEKGRLIIVHNEEQ